MLFSELKQKLSEVNYFVYLNQFYDDLLIDYLNELLND